MCEEDRRRFVLFVAVPQELFAYYTKDKEYFLSPDRRRNHKEMAELATLVAAQRLRKRVLEHLC